MDLGHAAQGVCVLYPVALGLLQDLGALGEQADVLRHLHLPLLTADGVDPDVEGVELAGQRRQRQGADQIGQTGGADGIIEVQRAHAGHGAGAVGDAQTLLADQGLQRLDPGQAQGFRSRQKLALVIGPAQAQQHQAHMGQGRQVPGSAERALLGHPGGHALVQQLQ